MSDYTKTPEFILGGQLSCSECDYVFYDQDGTKLARKAREHVRKYGHEVWVEKVYTAGYKPIKEKTNGDTKADTSNTGRNTQS